MNETKFTPGPWTLGKPVACATGPGLTVPIDGRYHFELATVVWQMNLDAIEGHPSPEQEANAYLIAAAPDLYEAAKLFEKTILYEIARSQSDGDEEGARMKTVSLNVLRETLAKAEGRTHEPAP